MEQPETMQAVLASRIGIPVPQISDAIRLPQLPEHLQAQVAWGAVSAAHGRELLRVDPGAEQDTLAAAITGEGLSVRDTAARRASAAAERNPQFERIFNLLAELLAAQVRLSPQAGQTTRIAIDVPDADLTRVLTQFGIQAAA